MIMKRKIRQLVRSGWILIELKQDIVEWHDTQGAAKNTKQYQRLCKWCVDNVPEGGWYSSLVASSGSATANSKRFAFKDEKFAAWFKLLTS